jgi:hypothetical protein
LPHIGQMDLVVETPTFIQTNRFLLVDAGFEPQDRLVCSTSLVLNPAQQSLRHSPTTRRWPRVHPFNFGVIVEHCHTATADSEAVHPGHEETHIGRE